MQHPPSSNYSDWHAYVWAKLCASRSPSGKTFSKVPLLCGVNSSSTSKKGTAADTGSYCMLWNFLSSSNHCFFFSANKVSTSTGGKGRHYFVGIVSCPILYQCFFAPIPAGPPVFWAFTLPPGEKGSSALETLCVGLAVSSLRCSGCFNNNWRHLDKL